MLAKPIQPSLYVQCTVHIDIKSSASRRLRTRKQATEQRKHTS